MKKFNEWRNAQNEWSEKDEIWSLVHELGPQIKPMLKKKLDELAANYHPEVDPNHAKIAIAQVLLDLAREYDPT